MSRYCNPTIFQFTLSPVHDEDGIEMPKALHIACKTDEGSLRLWMRPAMVTRFKNLLIRIADDRLFSDKPEVVMVPVFSPKPCAAEDRQHWNVRSLEYGENGDGYGIEVSGNYEMFFLEFVQTTAKFMLDEITEYQEMRARVREVMAAGGTWE